MNNGEGAPENPERRDWMKKALGWGVLGGVGAEAATYAGAGKMQLSKELFTTAKEFPPIQMENLGGSKLIFHGFSHSLENALRNYDQLKEAIASCDALVVEATHFHLWNRRTYELAALEEKDLRERLERNRPRDVTFFDVVALLAARLDKPIITTDPDNTLQHPIQRYQLNEFEWKTWGLKYVSLITAIASYSKMTLDTETSRRDMLTKLSGLAALITHAGTQAVSGGVTQRASEMALTPDSLRPISLGKILTEISEENFRDFGSVAGLYALQDIAPHLFDKKDIRAMYGGAHFQIMQIAKLPRNIIEMKLEIYRKLFPVLANQKARAYRFDRTRQNELGMAGSWVIETENIYNVDKTTQPLTR